MLPEESTRHAFFVFFFIYLFESYAWPLTRETHITSCAFDTAAVRIPQWGYEGQFLLWQQLGALTYF